MRVARTEGLFMDSESARVRWENAVFGGEGDLALLERSRRRAAQAYMVQRFAYLIEAAVRNVPAASFDLPVPKAATAKLKSALANPAEYFRLPDPMPTVERGRSIDHGDAIEYWLRFSGTTNGIPDRVIVHVYEPKDVPADKVPSLVFCHGLAMELEMLAEPPRDFLTIARGGVRVLLPDAPGHNRRCPLGFYGGESFIRTAPLSAVQHFREAAIDIATIVTWCKSQGQGKVGIGGVSLGALSVQVAASRWDRWPAEAKADALMLVTTTEEVSSLPLQSSLARAAGLDSLLRRAGWSEIEMAVLAPLTDASAEPPLDPAKIVLLLGEQDDLTPISGGRLLAQKWRIPAENLFLRNQGHFSAAIGLNAKPEPFVRIVEILGA